MPETIARAALDVPRDPHQVRTDSLYRYCVYGITVRSEIPLTLPEHGDGRLAHVELRMASASHFVNAIDGVSFQSRPGDWYQYGFLLDGSTYARWPGVGEFMVSADGLSINCRRFKESSFESFQVYMLGQALSFALVKQGIEPLHATVVVVNGRAAAFLGESGFGKSSLAACFIEAGYSVLTDDALVLQEFRSSLVAHPGPPRIKLFPQIARRFLDAATDSVSMNQETKKLILSINSKCTCAMPVPLGAIYVVAGPCEVSCSQPVSIQPLTPREGFLALVKNTFNSRLVSPERVQRKFLTSARVASLISPKKLSYPRILDRLPEVREAVLNDLGGG